MKTRILLAAVMTLTFNCAAFCAPAHAAGRWTEVQANDWYDKQPWLVGSNYVPADAINQLEMWQADSFAPERIDTELAAAEGIGMNTMRVFLHDQLWQQDAEGFKRRISIFLDIAAKHHIRPMFVLFDSCWDPAPHPGPQHPPIPGIHNSGWVQSPGDVALSDPASRPRLEAYVKGVVGAFAKDQRILAWDVWNEPDNGGGGNYTQMSRKQKVALVAALLPQVFTWARSAAPIQPLTSGVWHNPDWSPASSGLNAVERVQLAESDIISFHNYDWPEDLKKRIAQLRPYGRPLLLTEYMARGNGSLFDLVLPIASDDRIAVYNWGFIAGKSQTYFPWDSWKHPYVGVEPAVWFHDIFRNEGTPYRQAEIDLIKKLTQSQPQRPE